MDYKAFPFELLEAKAGQDGMEFSGYVSTFSNVDHGGDVVMPGAFDRTLKERDFRPLLWGHDQRLPPIGVEKSLVVDERGLLGTWEILDTSLGSDVYKALKAGAVRRMSMGYQAIDAEYTDDVRKLLDVELLESSVVNVPMNDEAAITGVKAASDLPLDDHAARVLGDVESFLVRVKDLASLRADDGRKLGAKHFERLETLRVSVAELIALKDAGELTSAPAINVRLELARRRLRSRGINVEHAS